VTEIALALGIDEVREQVLEGFQGVLLTDKVRSRGKILVNSARGSKPARFGIAHELGHFLMERHVLGMERGFLCSEADMQQSRTAKLHDKQESEANAFAIALLAPNSLIAPMLSADPSIEVVRSHAQLLDLSLEATTRCLIDRHDEPLAAIWTKDGIIRFIVRNERFPWINRDLRQKVSALSRTSDVISNGALTTTEMQEVAPAAWTNADLPELFEQVRLIRDGHALTLLWATLPESEED